MAQAIAGETGRPYVFVEPGAFINMFMGIGVLKVKGLYRKLRKLSSAPWRGHRLLRRGRLPSAPRRDGCSPRASRRSRSAKTSGFTATGSATWAPHSQNALVEHWNQTGQITPTEAPKAGWINRIMMGGMAGGGGMGTLQALLTEMNGLTKPRGITNKFRKMFGFRPKPPPKYRILHIMATNMPNALDEAMLRPGRIDRIYKVGYPSKEGRKQTIVGYLDKVDHMLNR